MKDVSGILHFSEALDDLLFLSESERKQQLDQLRRIVSGQ
jgi:hypothetical protein